MDINGLGYGILTILPADLLMVLRVIYTFARETVLRKRFLSLAVLCIISIFAVLIVFNKNNSDYYNYSRNKLVFAGIQIQKRCFSILVIGIIILSLGLFPYVVVRHSWRLNNIGVTGRDSVLACFGTAMVIHAMMQLINVRRLSNIALISLVLLGIISMNSLYLDYQTDYYRQLGFQQQMILHDEVQSCNTILYETEDLSDFTRFYSLNANAEVAFQDQTRFILDGEKDLIFLDNNSSKIVESFIKSPKYHMMDYSYDHSLDAVIVYNCPIKPLDTIKIKVTECFDREAFLEMIVGFSSLDVIAYDDYSLNAA